MSTVTAQIDLPAVNARFAELPAEARIAESVEALSGPFALSSSFGAQAAVLLHMVNEIVPEIPVVLIDTGYLFPETYQFIDQLQERLKLNLRVFRNELSPAWQEARFGKLWEQGLEGIEKYNHINKVQPMETALKKLGTQTWFAGLRRSQSESRANIPYVGVQKGRFKVHPIADWTDRDVGMYLKKHQLPYHPLWEKGYVSIGDWHTTQALEDGMREEDTRFFGLKRECGLHDYSI